MAKGITTKSARGGRAVTATIPFPLPEAIPTPLFQEDLALAA